MEWLGMTYINTTLPFCLCSAPKLFNAIADALEWIMRKRGVGLVAHYLGEFIFISRADSAICNKNMAVALETCEEVVQTHEVEGPATCPGCGDRHPVNWAMSTPRKVDSFVAAHWSRKCCTLKDLQSLVAHLSYAFLREMYLMAHGNKKWHRVRLTPSFKADLEWWHIINSWLNGMGCPCLDKPISSPWTYKYSRMHQAHGDV